MKPGYYWVKLLGEWRVAHLFVKDGCFWMHGTAHEYKLTDFDQIGKRIKEPK